MEDYDNDKTLQSPLDSHNNSGKDDSKNDKAEIEEKNKIYQQTRVMAEQRTVLGDQKDKFPPPPLQH